MKKCAFGLLSFICTTAFSAQFSLLGTWSGDPSMINKKGTQETIHYQIKITHEKDNLLKGVASWKALSGENYTVDKDLKNSADEPIIGTYDAKHNTYYFVETTEHSLIKIELLGNNEIHVIYLEGGGEGAVAINGNLKKLAENKPN